MKNLFYSLIFITVTGCASTTFALKENSMQDKGGMGGCSGYPHGSVIYGYTNKTAPCTEAARTCVNGSWNGPEVFSTCN